MSSNIFLIQNANEGFVSEYLSYDELVREISEVKKHDGDEPYFTYYMLDKTYTRQELTALNMSEFYHVVVNNNYLRDYFEPYGRRCVNREYLENLAYYTDVERMDAFYHQLSGTSTDDDKAELAEAYMQLFGQMCYDYACDKFSYDGLKDILSIVEKVEALQGETLWELRADAYLNLMDAAVAEDPGNTVVFGLKCVDALKKYILEVGVEYRSCQKLSRVYHMLADNDERNSYKYWQNALTSIKEAVKQSPGEVNWLYYLELLYTPLEEEVKEISKRLAEERTKFGALIDSLQMTPGIHYRVAKDFWSLRQSGSYEIQDQEYYFWLNKSLEREASINNDFPELLDAAHFYHKEGVIYERLDLLERALEYYEYQRNNDPQSGFVVYYVARTLEDIGTVYAHQGDAAKADEYMNRAFTYYDSHEDIIKSNYSSLSHYCEFLERCYHYEGAIEKPSIEKIRSVARLTEQEGKGFYSTPFLVQARLALEEKNETLAIFQLERSLLLHELCIDNLIKEFADRYTGMGFIELNAFLKVTLAFMQEVEEGYFYNPELRWPEIEKMNRAELKQAWADRMEEIRNRKK